MRKSMADTQVFGVTLLDGPGKLSLAHLDPSPLLHALSRETKPRRPVPRTAGAAHITRSLSIAFPTPFFEMPAPFSFDPVVGLPMVPATLANPVALDPYVAVTAPNPVSGRPDVANPRTRNHFDARHRRGNLDYHGGEGLVGNRQRHTTQSYQHAKKHSSYQHGFTLLTVRSSPLHGDPAKV
jgi:hypothetical protein